MSWHWPKHEMCQVKFCHLNYVVLVLFIHSHNVFSPPFPLILCSVTLSSSLYNEDKLNLNNRSDCLTHSICRKKSRTCLILEFLWCELGGAEWAYINKWLKVCWTCWEWDEPKGLKWMVSRSSVQQLKVKSVNRATIGFYPSNLGHRLDNLCLSFQRQRILIFPLMHIKWHVSLWILKWIGTWKMVGFQVWCLFWLL